MGMGEIRAAIAKRAAAEITNGSIVNLGIGIPSVVPNYLPTTIQVKFQAENGILGMGPTPERGTEDENLCNAAGYPVTVMKGASYFDSAMAFGMIRAGKVDVSILGALQVSQYGDVANWIVPGKRVPGVGGAMELAFGARRLIILMTHTERNGKAKIVEQCTLPLTARRCAHRIITERAVIDVKENGLHLVEVMPGYTIEEVLQSTDAPLYISDEVKSK